MMYKESAEEKYLKEAKSTYSIPISDLTIIHNSAATGTLYVQKSTQNYLGYCHKRGVNYLVKSHNLMEYAAHSSDFATLKANAIRGRLFDVYVMGGSPIPISHNIIDLIIDHFWGGYKALTGA